MLDKILNFITPGPLDEIVGFGARVFSSWISLGLVLGLINIPIYIASVPGATLGLETVVAGLISGPLLMCVWGLIGLGVNSILGRSSQYPGWYWFVFPISTCFLIGLWFTLAWLGFLIGLLGIKLPAPSKIINHPTIILDNTNQPLVDDWIKQNAEQNVDNFLNKNPNFKPSNNQEKSVYEKIVKNSNKTIDEIVSEMSEEEFQIFLEMLMRVLGIKFVP